MTAVALSDISINGGTQAREALNEATVADYEALIRDGVDFPPVTLFFDGSTYWLGDGFHRFFAYKGAGAVELPADIRQGTRRDAIWFGFGANRDHGLPMTNADKRKAVSTILEDEEWSKLSDREIARTIGVSNRFVSNKRSSVNGSQIEGPADSDRTRIVTRGGTTYQQNTARIGAPTEDKAAKREARAAEQAENDRHQADIAAKLPASIQQTESYRQTAKDRAKGDSADGGEAPPVERTIPELEAEIAELREAAGAMQADLAARDAKLKRFEAMRVQYELGGFDKVVEGKDEQIRVLRLQVEKESSDKVSYKKSLDWAMAELRKRGWTGTDVVIDAKTGAIVNGAAA